MDLEALKEKLKSYKKEQIRFNNPHFSQQLTLREGNKEEVIKNLLNPEKLIHYDEEQGKYGDKKISLYFEISNTRAMKIPVIFDKPQKSLYVITYIMRHISLNKKGWIRK